MNNKKLLKHLCHKVGSQHYNLYSSNSFATIMKSKNKYCFFHPTFQQTILVKQNYTHTGSTNLYQVTLSRKRKKKKQNSPTPKGATNFSEYFQEQRNCVKQGFREYVALTPSSPAVSLVPNKGKLQPSHQQELCQVPLSSRVFSQHWKKLNFESSPQSCISGQHLAESGQQSPRLVKGGDA